jgi:hypothetical protein
MHPLRNAAGGALLVATLLAACAGDMTSPTPTPTDRSFTLITIEEEKTIPDAEFDLADEDKVLGICVKETPSGHLVLKDANAATPSQLCPPPFVAKVKGESIKIQKEWFLEDENRNGAICVKETGAGRWLVVDDNLNTPSQPCPPAYHSINPPEAPPHKIPGSLLAEADDNFNAMVCVHIADGSGNFVVRDDNLDLPGQPCPPSFFVENVKKKEPPRV